ncbi:MAG: HAD-IA family hydrolase [Propionibacteriaceae bacterium]
MTTNNPADHCAGQPSEQGPAPTRAPIRTVVFDLGQVVLRWVPERPYARVLPGHQIPEFMAEISFSEWNRGLDAGRSIEAMEAELVAQLPHRREAIEAYRTHFDASVTGMVEGTGAILAELAAAGVRLLALTNWSADLFRPTRRRFDLLQRFEGIVVSGEEKITKPDPALFRIVFDRYQVDPTTAAFVDDSAANCATATNLGMAAIPFVDADSTRERLVELGVLGPRTPITEPVFHVAKRKHWAALQADGHYPWSSRCVTYEQEGFVHLSYADQVAGVVRRFYAADRPQDLVVLELDPSRAGAPIIVEHGFPHLFGPVLATAVVATRDLETS